MRYFILVLALADIVKMVKCHVLLSSLEADQPIYPGEKITFTCEAESPIIAWASDEFIGQGGAQIEFSSFDSIGKVRRSVFDSSTYAELVSVEVNSNNYRLVSELHIVPSAPQNASVSCIDVGNGYHSTYRFVVDGLAVDCSVPQNGSTCPDEHLTFTCVARDSLILAWQSDEYIGTGGVQIQFSIHDSPGTIRQGPRSTNTVAMLLDNSHERGVPTLRCQLNITVSSTIIQEYHHSVICMNGGLRTHEIFSFRKKDTCEQTTNPKNDFLVTVGNSGSSNIQAFWSIVISALLVMIATFE